jgi:hypothetical protein
MILEKINNLPYTYLIGWSELNIWYYGCQYAKDCCPNNFWVTYFTSSKYVSEFVAKHGDPDIKQIRKVFNDSEYLIRVEKCRAWEDKVIKKLGAVKSPHWLNKANNGTHFSLIYAICNYCNKDIPISNLSDHEKHCSENPNKVERECCFCFQKFTDVRNHKRHERHCNSNPNREDLPEYICEYCDKIYYDNGKRNDHEKHCESNPNRVDKPYHECQYCKKQFQGIAFHELWCEYNPNRIILPTIYCEHCKKEFKNAGALAIHERECLLNPNRKNLDCPFCEKKFTDTRNSVRHIRYCELNPNKESRPAYSCQYCGKNYEIIGRLKSHELICKCKK